MRSFDRCAFTDFTRMCCSDIFKLIRLDVVNAGQRRSRGRGGSGIGVWVGGGVRGGDDGGCQSEPLQQAVFGISLVPGRWFSCEEAVKALRRT